MTDSTACLPGDLIRAYSVRVVPLRLLAGKLAADDGDAGTAAAVEEEAAARGERLSTARPAPELFAVAYREAAAAGAEGVVSVHLSGLLSGTVGSAELAAASAPVPVRVIDARSIGMGLGLAVLAAASAASAGRSLAEVAAITERQASQTGSFFVLDSTDALLAAGRLAAGRPAAGPAAGGLQAQRPGDAAGQARVPALVSRPLLAMRDGEIVMLERVRTRAAAAVRLTELAAAFADSRAVDVAVQHVRSSDRAAALPGRLAEILPTVRNVYLAQAGTAIRIHAGPGMLGVALAPHPPLRSTPPPRTPAR